jgi:hypothetical protein
MTQPTLDGTPPAPGDGLWRRVLANGEINHAAWLHVRAEGGFVGTCRKCGHYLIPQRPEEHAGRTDYEADCQNEECGGVILAPGGRVIRHSAAKSLQPKGS